MTGVVTIPGTLLFPTFSNVPLAIELDPRTKAQISYDGATLLDNDGLPVVAYIDKASQQFFAKVADSTVDPSDLNGNEVPFSSDWISGYFVTLAALVATSTTTENENVAGALFQAALVKLAPGTGNNTSPTPVTV